MNMALLPSVNMTVLFSAVLYLVLSALFGAVAGYEGWKREQQFKNPYVFVGIGVPTVVAILTFVAASCCTKIDIGIAYWTLIGALLSTAMVVIAYWATKLWDLGSESFKMWVDEV